MSEVVVNDTTVSADSGSNAAEAAPAAEAEAATEQQTFDADYVRSLRQEAAKYRTQAKEWAEKAKAYDDWQETQKSESQKMQEALEAASKERDELRADLLRAQVANRKSLPEALANRLRGDTLEDMEADAEALLEGLKGQYVEKQRSTPDQTGAGVVGEANDTMTTEDFLSLLKKRG